MDHIPRSSDVGNYIIVCSTHPLDDSLQWYNFLMLMIGVETRKIILSFDMHYFVSRASNGDTVEHDYHCHVEKILVSTKEK